MKCMAIVKATAASEAGAMPSEKLLTDMGAFNAELVKAGVLLAGEGLHPSTRGARVRFDNHDHRSVVNGPFSETKDLVAGFWMLEVGSMEEAIEWMKRCPNPAGTGGEAEIEIRQVISMEDWGAELTPELREQEERLRQQAAAR